MIFLGLVQKMLKSPLGVVGPSENENTNQLLYMYYELSLDKEKEKKDGPYYLVDCDIFY